MIVFRLHRLRRRRGAFKGKETISFPEGEGAFKGKETISSPTKERTAFPDIPSLIAQVNNYSQVIDTCIKPYLLNCIDCFAGG